MTSKTYQFSSCALQSESPILNFLSKHQKQSHKNLTNQKAELKIRATGANVVQSKFTLYDFEIELGTLRWTFQTRYSLLKVLDDQISKQLKMKIVKFPDSKLFGNLEQEFIQRRTTQLEIYLKSLIKYGQRDKVVQRFISESQKGALSVYDPSQLETFIL